MSDVPWAALIPLIIVGLAFVIWCIRDVLSQTSTRHLPKWAWAIICAVTVPLGGIAYLILGREGATPLGDADL